jgi:hypothetical protein
MTKEELEEKVAALEEENKTLLDENEALQKKLESNEKDMAEALPILTIDKVKYKLLSPRFNYQGKIMTFEDLKADKDLQKELVEKQVGILQKQ